MPVTAGTGGRRRSTRPGGGAWKQTIFWPLMQASLYGRGESLLPQLTAEKTDTKHYSDVPVVDAAAVRGDDGSLTIFAVNRDLQEDAALTLDLRSFGAFSKAEHSVLHHDDMKAVNTELTPDNVKPARLPFDRKTSEVILPAASWNVIRLWNQ